MALLDVYVFFLPIMQLGIAISGSVNQCFSGQQLDIFL